MRENVKLYLQMCCEQAMEDGFIVVPQPGQLCWTVKQFNWPMLDYYFQAIILSEDEKTFTLELWDTIADIGDEPKSRMTILSSSTLKELHLHLERTARAESLKQIKRLIPVWKDAATCAIERLSEGKKKILKSKIEYITESLEEIQFLIESENPNQNLEKLIQIQVEIDKTIDFLEV